MPSRLSLAMRPDGYTELHGSGLADWPVSAGRRLSGRDLQGSMAQAAWASSLVTFNFLSEPGRYQLDRRLLPAAPGAGTAVSLTQWLSRAGMTVTSRHDGLPKCCPYVHRDHTDYQGRGAQTWSHQSTYMIYVISMDVPTSTFTDRAPWVLTPRTAPPPLWLTRSWWLSITLACRL